MHPRNCLFLCLLFPWFNSTSPSCFHFRSLSQSNCSKYFPSIYTSRVTSFPFTAHIAFQFAKSCHLLNGYSSRKLHLTALTQSFGTDLSTNLASSVSIMTFIPKVLHSKLDQDTITFWVGIFPQNKCRIIPQ